MSAQPAPGVVFPLRKVTEDHMPKLLLLAAGTAALLSAVATLTPRADATTMLVAAASTQRVAQPTLVEQARMACTHRRVCHQGAGCAWRKVCKRW